MADGVHIHPKDGGLMGSIVVHCFVLVMSVIGQNVIKDMQHVSKS